MIIVINGRTSDEATIADYIRNTFLPPRLTILLYLMGPQNPQRANFPVNFLHSERGDEPLHDHGHGPLAHAQRLPGVAPCRKCRQWRRIRSDSPSVLFQQETHSAELSHVQAVCFDVSGGTMDIISSGLDLMPKNKTELEACLLARACDARKPGIRTHVGIPSPLHL